MFTVQGTLTRDPNIRYSREGMPTVSFDLAQAEPDDVPSVFYVEASGDLAENVTLSLVSGAEVIVTGELRVRRYLPEEGQSGERVILIASNVACSLRHHTVAEPPEHVYLSGHDPTSRDYWGAKP
jgi:single-stranded DNA-binding protein